MRSFIVIISLLAIYSTANAQLAIPATASQLPDEITSTLLFSRISKELLTLRLPVNIGLGASWHIKELPDSSLTITSEEFHSVTEKVILIGKTKKAEIGNGEVEVIEFPELAPGLHEYTLDYGRGFGSAPWKTVKLKVEVKDVR